MELRQMAYEYGMGDIALDIGQLTVEGLPPLLGVEVQRAIGASEKDLM
jgi:hypothetical protein